MAAPVPPSPLLADELIAILQQAMTLPVDDACTVYVEIDGLLVHATARIDDEGDVVIAPWAGVTP